VSKSTARVDQIHALTGLRSIAAVWVVVFHLGWFVQIALPTVASALHPLLITGAQGVDLFFLLSGYVLALNYTERIGDRVRLKSTVSFLGARVARVWPVYVVMLHVNALWMIVQLKFGHLPPVSEFSALSYLRQLFMVELWSAPYFDGTTWDGPAWSISAEWLAYMMFPLLALVLFRMRRLTRGRSLLVLAFVISLAPSLLVAGTGQFYTPYSWVLRILSQFTAGAVAYTAVARLRPSDRTRRTAGYLSVVVGVVIVCLFYQLVDHPVDRIRDSPGLINLLFLPLIVTLAIGTTGLARVLSWRPFVFSGEVSYSLYLVHGLCVGVLTWVWHQTSVHPTGMALHLLAPAVLVTMFLFAWFLYRNVEEPGRKWIRGMVEFRVRPTVEQRHPTGPDEMTRNGTAGMHTAPALVSRDA
jgi:peptidoglycan/LPS O-acetylase OafA/YrhL